MEMMSSQWKKLCNLLPKILFQNKRRWIIDNPEFTWKVAVESMWWLKTEFVVVTHYVCSAVLLFRDAITRFICCYIVVCCCGNLLISVEIKKGCIMCRSTAGSDLLSPLVSVRLYLWHGRWHPPRVTFPAAAYCYTTWWQRHMCKQLTSCS